jgi:hypothetical protein
MMNSKFIIENSKLFAQRLTKPGLTPTDQIRSAYMTVFSRPPSNNELTRAITFIEKTSKKFVDRKADSDEGKHLALAAFCQALFASSEFRFLN